MDDIDGQDELHFFEEYHQDTLFIISITHDIFRNAMHIVAITQDILEHTIFVIAIAYSILEHTMDIIALEYDIFEHSMFVISVAYDILKHTVHIKQIFAYRLWIFSCTVKHFKQLHPIILMGKCYHPGPSSNSVLFVEIP